MLVVRLQINKKFPETVTTEIPPGSDFPGSDQSGGAESLQVLFVVGRTTLGRPTERLLR